MKIEFINQKEITKRMESRAKRLKTAARVATEAAANFALETLPPYPSAARKPMKWASLRQKFYVLYSIQDGTLDIPYRRSGFLGRSITTSVEEKGNQVLGYIGTNDKKAPWVISASKVPSGRGPQAPYHEGNWWTLQGHVASKHRDIVRIYKDRLSKAIRG